MPRSRSHKDAVAIGGNGGEHLGAMVTLIIEIRRIGIHEIARTHNIHVLQITNLINVHKATVDHRNEDALAVEPRLMQFCPLSMLI